jgi:hypothetical protein
MFGPWSCRIPYTLEKENANKMGSPYLNWFDEYYAGLGISTPELFPNV